MAFGDIVQQTIDGQRTSNTLTLTLASTPTEDNLLVLLRGTGGTDITTPTGWTLAASQYSANKDDMLKVYYKIAGASESSSVSSTSTSGSEDYGALIEVEGPWDTGALIDDWSTSDENNDNQIVFGDVDTSSSDPVWLFAGWWARIGNGQLVDDVSYTNSFTSRDTYEHQFKGIGWGDRVVSDSGTYNTTLTINNTPLVTTEPRWGVLVAFKGTSPNPTLTLSQHASTQIGDLLVAGIRHYSATAPTGPAGWTKQYTYSAGGTGRALSIFTRSAASAGSADHVFTSGDTNAIGGHLASMENGATYKGIVIGGGQFNTNVLSSLGTADNSESNTVVHFLATTAAPADVDEIDPTLDQIQWSLNDATSGTYLAVFQETGAVPGAPIPQREITWTGSESSTWIGVVVTPDTGTVAKAYGTTAGPKWAYGIVNFSPDFWATGDTVLAVVLTPATQSTAPAAPPHWTNVGSGPSAGGYRAWLYRQTKPAGTRPIYISWPIEGTEHLQAGIWAIEPTAATLVYTDNAADTGGSTTITVNAPDASSITAPRLRFVAAIAEGNTVLTATNDVTLAGLSRNDSNADVDTYARSQYRNEPGAQPPPFNLTNPAGGLWLFDIVLGSPNGTTQPMPLGSTTKRHEGNADAQTAIGRTESVTVEIAVVIARQESATADAQVIVQRTEAGSADANTTIQRQESATADAETVVQRTEAGSADANTTIQRQESATADAQVIVQKTPEGSADARTAVQRTEAGSADANTTIQRQESATADAQVIVQRTEAGSSEINVVVAASSSATADANTTIQRTEAGSADGLAAIARQESATADAQVIVQRAESATADANATVAATPTDHADAQVIVQRAESATADAQTAIQATLQDSADARTAVQRTEAGTVDAETAIGRTESATADAETTISATRTGSANALVYIQGQQTQGGAAAIQAAIEKTLEGSADAETAIGRTEAGQADAQTVIQRQASATADAETTISATQESSATVETAIGDTITNTADAETTISKTGTGSAEINVYILAPGTNEGSADALAVIQATRQGSTEARTAIERTRTSQADALATVGRTETVLAAAETSIQRTSEGMTAANATISRTGTGSAEIAVYIETETHPPAADVRTYTPAPETRTMVMTERPRVYTPEEPPRRMAMSNNQQMPPKDPADRLDYSIDWSRWLPEGATITDSAWTVDGLTLEAGLIAGLRTTAYLSGGSNGQEYKVTNEITATIGGPVPIVKQLSIYIPVTDN